MTLWAKSLRQKGKSVFEELYEVRLGGEDREKGRVEGYGLG